MKEIPLTKGKIALVDDSDFEWLNQWKWTTLCCGKDGAFFYAYRYPGTAPNRTVILMHKLIMGADSSQMVDHRDFNTLNNQRENLRVCTRSQNNHNCHVKRNSRSRIKGVHFDPETNKWIAEICLNYKRIKLGRFSDPLTASKAYDEAASKYFGEFARTNKSLVIPCQP